MEINKRKLNLVLAMFSCLAVPCLSWADSIRRKETYGSSGPLIRLRFFGG